MDEITLPPEFPAALLSSAHRDLGGVNAKLPSSVTLPLG